MFSTHKLNEQGFAKVKIFKNEMAEAASAAVLMLPDGRDKSIFITKLEEAMFFGTRAIASQQGNFESIIEYPQV